MLSLVASLAVSLPAHAQASLGPLETRQIYSDPVYKVSTSSTWNPHLSKLVVGDEWSYALFTRFQGLTEGQGLYDRVTWIYKRRNEEQSWTYAGRAIHYFNQHPGIALDTAGRLHLVFDCADDYLPCTSGGASSGADDRHYHLIFHVHKPDGSIDFDYYENWNEHVVQANGYLGLATDPSSNKTFGSLLNANRDQIFFHAGTYQTQASYFPELFHPSQPLYPQIAVSPAGTRYYTAAEYIEPWECPGSSQSPARYKGFVLYKLTASGFPGSPSFSGTSPSPCGEPPTGWTFPSDMSIGPDGSLYLLYYRSQPGSVCTFLVKEATPGSGSFLPRTDADCHSSWAQLQVDSAGRIYIVESDDSGTNANLKVSESVDGGENWTHHSFPVSGLPQNSQGILWPTLVKPWTSPSGYDPDVLQGFVANGASLSAYSPQPFRSWSSHDFTLEIED